MIEKTCENCKHSERKSWEVPCTGCIDSGTLEFWEQAEKNCDNCRYTNLNANQDPCSNCVHTNNFAFWGEREQVEQAEQAEQDNVNHPKHYEGSTSLECIEVMQIAFGSMAVCDFCICNAFKYLWRYKNKNGEEDLKKAEWYLNKAEELAEYEVDKGRIKDLKEIYNKHTEVDL